MQRELALLHFSAARPCLHTACADKSHVAPATNNHQLKREALEVCQCTFRRLNVCYVSKLNCRRSIALCQKFFG